jgi:hypothetical protein
VSFISPAAHRKFILQCESLISTNPEQEMADQKAKQLKSDLDNLQQLAEAYLKMISQLPVLAREYNELQRRIRVNARKIKNRA